ncbi:unnamed protein product [Somion occarium]|uniref:Secreted protein n=1 Tax=Somion occarium TaxID=3059160 RepID=A0ABP1DSZ7_9APHY
MMMYRTLMVMLSLIAITLLDQTFAFPLRASREEAPHVVSSLIGLRDDNNWILFPSRSRRSLCDNLSRTFFGTAFTAVGNVAGTPGSRRSLPSLFSCLNGLR